MGIAEYAIASRFAAIGIALVDRDSVGIDLLWVDRDAPAVIDINDIGVFHLPISAIENKNSRLFFNVILSRSS